MRRLSPLWIADRRQDWRDEGVLAAIEWLQSFTKRADWDSRQARIRQTFEAAKVAWRTGEQVALHDPKDLIAWYVFQANAYACSREDWYEPEGYRIAPLFRRLGALLPELRSVSGIEERVDTFMNKNISQADDGLFELLVAGAYRCRQWNVQFVTEQKGGCKTPDLYVEHGRRRWAAECKRVNLSGYEDDEYRHGLRLARPLHTLCAARGCSLIAEVTYDVELEGVPDDYLAEHAREYLRGRHEGEWQDAQGRGRLRPVDWRIAQEVLRHDDVFFNSSRMVELLAGNYEPRCDHDIRADWIPGEERPFHATAMRRASLVSWHSGSLEAALRKAKHFRALVARAAEQLPADRPGVIHVGYESRNGNSVDEIRHMLNRREVEDFDARGSRLRWVYGNYLSPEHTTARNESSAMSETTATYRVGQHKVPDPLRKHLLLTAEKGRPGTHW